MGPLMSRLSSFLFSFAVLGAVSLSASSVAVAAKPRKETAVCIDSFERSQEHRRDQKLLQARTELLLCSASTCPAAIQKPCTAWLAELGKQLPTIVLHVESADGVPSTTATATLDDDTSPKTLGTALEVDPGQHRVDVREEDGSEASLTLAIQPGEKDKKVVIRLPARPKATEAPPPPAPTPPRRRGLTAGPIALFSTTVVATGVFTVLGLGARSDANELRARCAPSCPHDEVDAVRRKALGADIALGVGVVTLGLGLWAALSRPSVAHASSSAPTRTIASTWTPLVVLGGHTTAFGGSLRF